MSGIWNSIGLSTAGAFNSQVGARIERATHHELASEDWTLNIEVCDIINETEDGPKDAVKAFRKRLSGNKNYKALLETCVKNCGHRFHMLICQKDFVNELVKIIGPKNNPPTVVQDKVLSLIQTWADSFRGSPDLKGVVQIHHELKEKGIEFPATDLDTLVPIHTPARSVMPAAAPTPPQSPARVQQQPALNTTTVPNNLPMGQPPSQTMTPPPPAQLTPPPLSTANQMTKLRNDLSIVEQNHQVLSEMLTELKPGQENPSDLELLQELNQTCRAMQTRVMELLNQVAAEEITGELLRVNDELNNVFVRYDRHERYRASLSPPRGDPPQQTLRSPTSDTNAHHQEPPRTELLPSFPPPVPQQQPGDELPSTEPLIDLSLTGSTYPAAPPAQPPDLSNQLASLNFQSSTVGTTLEQLNNNTPQPQQQQQQLHNNDDFDMFAQSRQSFDQHKSSTVAYDAAISPQTSGLAEAMTSRNKEANDKVEIEEWMKVDKSDLSQEPMTSAEFDMFLSERSKTDDGLPDVPTEEPTSSPQRQGRQLKLSETEDALFGL